MNGYEQYCESTGELCSLLRHTARSTTGEASKRPKDDIIFTLRVRWHAASGKCRTNVLNLRHLEGVQDLEVGWKLSVCFTVRFRLLPLMSSSLVFYF